MNSPPKDSADIARLVFDRARDTSVLTGFPLWSYSKILELVVTDPPPQEWVFHDLLPRGVVGALLAQGATGKTYLLLYLALSASLGVPMFRCFEPEKPLSVMAILGEDPEVEIHRRLRLILKEISDLNFDLLAENLLLVCGQSAPLMALDERGNPTRTEAYDWLKFQAGLHRPDLILLDPKAQFYGLEENSNEHATQWIVALKELAEEAGGTLLFTHHVNKSSRGALEQSASRGGSSLTDACRWVANMRRLDEDSGKKLGVREWGRYFEFLVTKNSYAPALPKPLLFKFEDGGTIAQVDPGKEKAETVGKAIFYLLTEESELSKRDIVKGTTGQDFRGTLHDYLGFKPNREEIENGLKYGLREGLLWEESVRTGATKQEKKIVRKAGQKITVHL